MRKEDGIAIAGMLVDALNILNSDPTVQIYRTDRGFDSSKVDGAVELINGALAYSLRCTLSNLQLNILAHFCQDGAPTKLEHCVKALDSGGMYGFANRINVDTYKLADWGMLQNISKGHYKITPLGRMAYNTERF